MRFIADDRRTWSVYIAQVALLTVVTFGSLGIFCSIPMKMRSSATISKRMVWVIF